MCLRCDKSSHVTILNQPSHLLSRHKVNPVTHMLNIASNMNLDVVYVSVVTFRL